MSTTREFLKTFILSTPVFSTHEHHRELTSQQQLDLDTLFNWSYVGWCAPLPEATLEARAEWLDRIRYNSYFVWLEKAVSEIYDVQAITPENWDAISARIQASHQDSDHHIRILKERAKYLGFLEDCYWDTGSDVGYPGFATPVYRLDMWMQGYHPDTRTNEGTNIHATYGAVIPSFASYLSLLEQEIRRRRNIAGLKCAAAYQRSIHFQRVTVAEAESVYLRHPDELTQNQKNAFGDYILQHAVELAADLELPIQIHTGLARLKGSSPLLLEELIADNPRNRFVLFHGGFPWIYETAALAHNYSNVWLDINWLPLISTTAACQALHVYMEVLGDSGKIAWGGDTWTSEEALGAAMAFRHILTQVLVEKVDSGYLTAEQAKQFAKKIMFQNAMNLYGLERHGNDHQT